jgi:hypothetical protein
MMDTKQLAVMLADTKNKLVAPTAKLRAMAPDLAAEVIRLRAEVSSMSASGSWYKETDIDAMQNEITALRAEKAAAVLAAAELLEVSKLAMRLSAKYPDFKLYAMEPMQHAIDAAIRKGGASMTRTDLQKIMDTPGFGTGRAFRDKKAQEAEALALLPDRAWMAPVMASTDGGSNWLICSFGCSNDDGEDWHLVTDHANASALGDAMFPIDARTDAMAIAALCNAWRMGLLVVKEGAA